MRITAHTPAILVACLVLASSSASCVSQHVENRSILEDTSAGDRGVTLGRLPACEKGQIAGEGGKCLDVVEGERGGKPRTRRERVLERDCELAATVVTAAAMRRRQVLSVPNHEVHLGLSAVVAECKTREEQLDVCERAGRYAADSPYRDEKVRQRDALEACRGLADLYRKMLARGIRRTP